LYAYLWYELDNDALKIGVGEVPAERMLAYAVQFGLRPEPRSLTTIEIPRGEAIRVYNHLLDIYIEGLDLRLVDGFADLYRVGNRYTFPDLRGLFMMVVRDIAAFTSEPNERRQRRMKELCIERVHEWRDINNGGHG